MKYLIIGLGHFGKTLAEELTDKGHEVIGIDSNERAVEELKDKISVAYIMESTEVYALKMLPLDEIDCTVVALSQSMDKSLRTVAALKELSVKNIYARALDKTHQSILKAMNVEKIFMPEYYAAKIFANMFLKKMGEETDLLT